MYYYVSSMARQRKNGQSFVYPNLENVKIADIQKQYSEVVFELSTNFANGNVFLTLKDLEDVGVNRDKTVAEYLTSIANGFIGDNTTPYSITSTQAHYKDLLQAGYTWEHIDRMTNIPGSPITDRPDLSIIRENTDYHELASHVIFTVNGLAHRTVFDNNRCVVIGGTRSMLTANQNTVGMLSFAEVGEVEQIAITTGMFNDPADTDGYWNGIYLKTGQDLTGKSVILSFAGYLHVADGVCRIVNKEEGIVRIDVSNLPLLERIFDLRKLISLVSVPLSSYLVNEGAVKLSDLKDDNVLKGLLTLPQSFLAVVDTPSLYRKTHPVENGNLYNVYYTREKPVYPIQLHFGLLPEVWVRQEDDLYVLTCHHPLKRNLMAYTSEYRNEAMAGNGSRPEASYYRDHAFFVEIGTETLVQS